MELFAQLLLESRTGAYIEWLENELIKAANNNMNKDPSVPTRRIHHTMATRKTYPTNGNNFPTPKGMISFMVCWFPFCRKQY